MVRLFSLLALELWRVINVKQYLNDWISFQLTKIEEDNPTREDIIMLVKRRLAFTILLLVLCTSALFGLPAQAALDNKGTEFFMAFLPNYSGTANVELHLTADVTTDVTVQYPVNSPTFNTTVAVTPGSVTIVSLPSAAAQGWSAGTIQNNAVRAFSNQEFTAYMINRIPYTSDAALALPIDVLNTDYIVASYQSIGFGTEFAVAAPYDNTVVTITPKVALTGGYPAGTPFNITLNRGEAFLGLNPATGADLTGTLIKADKPIVLTNGEKCIYVPPGYSACDHIFEVAQPVQSWGQSALVAPLPNRPNGSVYRILASEDNTTVQRDGTVISNIDRGQFIDTGVLADAHSFTADKPIFVVQYMTGQSYPGSTSGDPAMGNMIPSAQYLRSYTFSTVGGNQFAQDYVSIIADDDDVSAGTILLDGTPVPAADFTAIGTSGFSFATEPLTSGVHTTASTSFHGITVEGYNNYDSYIYPGGAKFQFINPVGDANPPLCSFTPAGTSGSGNAEDDRPSEDVNNNGVLDPGEDLNNNGQIDKDTGIFLVELNPGSSNLTLDVDSFVPGAGVVNYTVNTTDPGQPGIGTLTATDGAGNTCSVQIDLRIVDTTPPSCFLSEMIAGPPTQIKVNTQDGGSGLKLIETLISTNAEVTWTPFTAGTIDPVIVTATKINQSQTAHVELRVTDMANNSVTCDPIITLVVRENGKPQSQTFTEVPQAESKVAILNGEPGVKNLDVVVNGQKFKVAGLGDGEQTTLDVSSAMLEGDNNTIMLTAYGKPDSSAVISISD